MFWALDIHYSILTTTSEEMLSHSQVTRLRLRGVKELAQNHRARYEAKFCIAPKLMPVFFPLPYNHFYMKKCKIPAAPRLLADHLRPSP